MNSLFATGFNWLQSECNCRVDFESLGVLFGITQTETSPIDAGREIIFLSSARETRVTCMPREHAARLSLAT